MPYMIQRVFFTFCNERYKNSNDLQSHIFQCLKIETKSYFDKQFLQLDKNEQRMLIKVAKNENYDSNEYELRNLISYGYIEEIEGENRILGQIFEQYLCDLHS